MSFPDWHEDEEVVAAVRDRHQWLPSRGASADIGILLGVIDRLTAANRSSITDEGVERMSWLLAQHDGYFGADDSYRQLARTMLTAALGGAK